MTDHKEPTDHLPPAEEREPDDERTTSGQPHPVDDVEAAGGVTPATAAEPEKPARHGVDQLPTGPR